MIEQAKQAVIDITAVSLGGYALLGDKLVSLVGRNGGHPTATVLGTGLKTSAPLAAFANGALAHALDYDDLNESMGGHPTAPVWPAALAVGEMMHASGRDVLLAYLLGVEIETKLGSTLIGKLYDSGWHPTAVLGTLGAAAAAGKLLHLDQFQLQMALGIAASFACGLKQNCGTTTKPLHIGQAAQNGVTAAVLASDGWESASDSLEGDAGFCNLFCGRDAYDLSQLHQSLGNPWEFDYPGIKQKKFPCCGSIHSSLEALLGLIKDNPLKPEEILEITCAVNPRKKHILLHPRPKTGIEAKFSLEYCIAAAVLNQSVTLDLFSDEMVRQPGVSKLLPRILVETSGQLPEWAARIQIKTYAGDVLTRVCEGFPSISSKADLLSKFKDCAKNLISCQSCEEIVESIWRIEEMDNITKLTQSLIADLTRS